MTQFEETLTITVLRMDSPMCPIPATKARSQEILDSLHFINYYDI